MPSPAYEIARYLEANGVGTFGGTTAAAWSINVAIEPPRPDLTVTIQDDGGGEPDTDELDIQSAIIQVRVRSAKKDGYNDAYAKHEEIKRLLIAPAPLITENMYIIGARMINNISYLGRDDNDRHVLLTSYDVQVQELPEEEPGPDPGPTYDPKSEAIFAAFTTPPTDERKAIIDAFVLALDAAGLFSVLDGYAPIGADEQASTINWIDPGSFTLIPSGTYTFLADRHWVGNGSDGFLDTQFSPTGSLGNYTQDSAVLFGRMRIAGSGGLFGGGANVLFAPDFPLVRMNQTAGFGPGGMNTPALWSINRDAANSVVVFKDGVQHATDAEASVSPGADTLKGLRAAGIFGTHRLSSIGWGGSLTPVQQAALAAAELTYMQAIGAV